MANFHTNNLVITANDEDMKKVLKQLAFNLAANKISTEFDMNVLHGKTTVEEIYAEISGVVESFYMLSFAEEDELEGQGLSDTASASLTRYGKHLVFTLNYSTAWSCNSEDLDSFFLGLPDGEYGVALYDADERDNYEKVSVFSGLLYGGSPLITAKGIQPELYDTVTSEELWSRKIEYDKIAKGEISNLGELARVIAICGWTEFNNSNDTFYNFSRSTNSRPFISNINWNTPQKDDLKLIDDFVIDTVCLFPWFNSTIHFTGCNTDRFERLLPGDTVVIESHWDSSGDPDKVTLVIKSNDNTNIGILINDIKFTKYGFTYLNHNYSAAILSCLLPHLTATIYSLTPASLRGAGVSDPALAIRLDLEPVDLKALSAEVRSLLNKTCSERSLVSKREQ